MHSIQSWKSQQGRIIVGDFWCGRHHFLLFHNYAILAVGHTDSLRYCKVPFLCARGWIESVLAQGLESLASDKQ